MIEIKEHPYLKDLLVRNDGWIFLPKKKGTAAHWTEGSINHGYRKIGYNNKNYSVHRLIAETFIPNPDNKPCVDHIDRNPLNNNVLNLRWATVQENNLNQKKNLPEGERSIDFENIREYENNRHRNWYVKNKDKINDKRLEQRRIWYDKNKERMKSYQREYYKIHKQKKMKEKSSSS